MAISEDGVFSNTGVFLSLSPSTARDRRLVWVLVAISAAILLVLLPFTAMPLGRMPAFIPAYRAALFIVDAITAAMLFGQFMIVRRRGLLFLAGGYLFAALIIVPFALSFEDILSPGAPAAGPEIRAWLYVCWHISFPLLVLGYALTRHDDTPLASPRAAIVQTIAAVTAVIAGIALVIGASHADLPVILRNDRYTGFGLVFMPVLLCGSSVLAFAALWRGQRSVLDLWMVVVMTTWLFDVGMNTVLVGGRYDLGFYAGRAFGLFAASFVLVMQLLETSSFYTRIAGELVGKHKTAERQRQRVFETSRDIILITDGKGDITQVSPSSLKTLGYAPEEMIGRSGVDFLFPEDLDSTRNEMRAARSGDATRNFRCRYIHKDGHVVSLIWTGVWSELDRRHFFIGRDVTESEHMEQQLRQSQKMEAVGQLTGGVAHDFNNILMVILANVEELLESDNLLAEQREQLENIAGSGQRAAQLTKRLLAFSRKQRLVPQSTDLTDLVASTDKLLRRTLGEQIEIEAILASDLWTTSVDRAQLEAALVNLCVNARDAMPNGGRLLIETKNAALDTHYAAANPGVAPGDYVMLAVSDTGVGMAPDIMAKVFEPFFTTKGVGKGTGLGLSMVYGFIKQSNGHVKIYSEVGRGTTIRLYMPRVDAPTEEATLAPAVAPHGNERILVVEDDRRVRTSVLTQLRSLGYTVTEATGAPAALDRLGNGETFDLMLTDVIMPGMDGPRLANITAERWPGMKVLFMSGYSENAAKGHGEIAPDAHVLSKPFRKIDLATRVREALGNA